MLFFIGLRIWEAVIDELMEKGLANSKQVIRACTASSCWLTIFYVLNLIMNTSNYEYHYYCTNSTTVCHHFFCVLVFRPYLQVVLLVGWLHYYIATIFVHGFLWMFQWNAFLMLDFSLMRRTFILMFKLFSSFVFVFHCSYTKILPYCRMDISEQRSMWSAFNGVVHLQVIKCVKGKCFLLK
jgi:hypothetical protein